MSNSVRVLVFGTTGVGKTSLCNALTNESQPIGDGVIGVTFCHHHYSEVPLGNKYLFLTDTIGLNESDKGRVTAKNAIKSLLQLLRESREGYNLLVHVVRKGRITQNEAANYNLFVRGITNHEIPVILVVTGCEDIEPMSKWKESNSEELSRMGLIYQDIVCTSFATSQRRELAELYKTLRQESCEVVRNSIVHYAKSEPVLVYSDKDGLWATVKRAWNTMCDFFGLGQLITNVEKGLAAFMRRIGLLDEEIKELLEDTNYLGKKK